MSSAEAPARRRDAASPQRRATYQDVLDAPPHRVAEIATAKDGAPVRIRPFEAITFSLGNLWP